MMKKALCLLLVCAMLAGMLPAAGASGSIDRFIDVPSSNCWFTKSVQYVNDNGLMNGISENLFDPEGPATRAMVVTVLHRMAGTPTVQSEGFDDVPADDWFTAAVHWAQANNIIQGFGDGTFRPHLPMNRQEMIAVFYRYALYKNYDTTLSADLSVFVDHADIADFATESMSWSVAAGLINGFPDQTIRPTALSTRAQMATILMRYADINQIPDNGNDEEDTEVTEDDTSILSASQYEVEATSYTTVAFYVNSTLTVPSFELYVDGSSTGIYLYDDGNYDSNGDDIPNDGCYTGIFNFDYVEEGNYTFSAVTTIGEETIKTNDIDILVYGVFTEEDYIQIDSIETGAAEIVSNVWSSMPDAPVDDVIAEIRDQIEAYLAPYVEAGVVSNVVYHSGNYMYSWDYPQHGLDTMLQIYDPTQNEDIKSVSTRTEPASIAPSSTSSDVSTAAIDVDLGVTYSNGKVVILNCYGPTHTWSLTYDAIGQQLADAGFDVTYIYDFECSDFMNLAEYDSMIMLNSHGNTDDGTMTGMPMICTEEEQSFAKSLRYFTDLMMGRIEKVTLVGGSKVYWIAPKLFEDYYDNDKLSSPIVNLGCCRNYPENNTQMVKAWRDAGAAAVCGYDASVSVAYDNDMADALVDNLLLGNSINSALTYAKNLHGTRDPSLDDDVNWNRHPVLKLYGDNNAILYPTLKNGSFDNASDQTNSVSNWTKYGDARSILRLAGIEPQSAPRMAIISSGFGSMGSETTSSIYQTFLVPGNANTIEFTYDVVSEEPMEYVGTIYDDIIQVDLLDTDGNILETLAYESVNTSTWYAIDGIDFPGGDHTTYHTRWNKVSSNVLSKYQGQLVVIRFVVQDAGDSIYDTALLVDSVRIK